MTKILTITFNPCIDKSTKIPALIPEKKLRCSPPVFEPGGGGINVARALKRFGANATAAFPAGGYSGKFLQALLKEEEIEMDVVESVHHTRENLIVLETDTNHQFRFGMPGPEILEKEWQQLVQMTETIEASSIIVASGSLSPGIPSDIFAQIARIAKKRKLKLVVDTSGEALVRAVEEGVYLIKPNLGELSSISGKQELRQEDIIPAAREVIGRGGTEIIVVSMGKAGALLVSKDQCIQAIPPTMQQKSTVGAGDSMVAGIVFCLSNNQNLEEALRYGVASGTAATLQPGTELCHREDVEKLLPLITIKRVSS